MTDQRAIFEIFCKVCEQETFAWKSCRRFRCGTRARCGINTCFCCGTKYEAPLPPDWKEWWELDDGERGSGVQPLAEDSAV